MKRLLSITMMTLVCITMSIVSIGCSSGIDHDELPLGPLDTQLLGKWKFDHSENMQAGDQARRYEFYNNGCVSRVTSPSQLSTGVGYWSAENGKLKLDFSTNGTYFYMYYKFKDGLLGLSGSPIDDDEYVKWFMKYEDVPQ